MDIEIGSACSLSNVLRRQSVPSMVNLNWEFTSNIARNANPPEVTNPLINDKVGKMRALQIYSLFD
jgi:hypothetical protein